MPSPDKKVIGVITGARDGKLDLAKLPPNTGFKSYKLFHSNFKKWKSEISDRDELLKQLEIFREPLVSRLADSCDLLVEPLLKLGVPLAVKVEKCDTGDGTPFYVIENGRFIYALDKISRNFVPSVAIREGTLKNL